MKINTINYIDLINVKTINNDEKLVSLKKYSYFDIHPINKDMEGFTGNDIFLREGAAKKLLKVAKELKNMNSNYKLRVSYGYRHPEIQREYFNKVEKKIKKEYPDFNKLQLNTEIHKYVAHPNVAGHPTGGAVDLTITEKDIPLDMGCEIMDFSDPDKMSCNCSNLAAEQQKNRELLQRLMINEGFAPFYGEWWHFCYGDKEWAKYYKQSHAIYDQMNYKNRD
ncbi:hypothetical protein HOB30_05570 [Candidatus Falkowbacteria bacterium]|jgi:zinc D-Ala-D-Ala dipeptidase|nr:hypothetical protein [Candidatus Falkowbacteria bacterium]